MNYQQLTEQYHLPVYNRYPITLSKGKGTYVWDEEGNKYLDALAGIAVNSLGHCHPKVVKAVREQVGQLMHISNFYYSKPQAKLLKLLASISGMDKGFICNSGGEAMEACLKAARKYGQAHQKHLFGVIDQQHSQVCRAQFRYPVKHKIIMKYLYTVLVEKKCRGIQCDNTAQQDKHRRNFHAFGNLAFLPCLVELSRRCVLGFLATTLGIFSHILSSTHIK